MFSLVVFGIILGAIIKAARKSREEEAKRLAQEEAARRKAAQRSTQSSQKTQQKSAPDPICENYDAARDALLQLYKDGAITEENLVDGNCELYDQYMKTPMEICNLLRGVGICDQAKIESDGDYAIFFKSEEAAWNACNQLNRSKNAKLVEAERRNTGSWAFIPFDLGTYRVTMMIDRKINLFKLVVRDRVEDAARQRLSSEELDRQLTEAFDFTK